MKAITIGLIAVAGVTGGMVLANYLTDGAVFEAASNLISSAKDRIVDKTQDTADAVADVAETVTDAVADVV